MSDLQTASSSSWMSLPLAVMALSWVLLPLGAIDLADFVVAQGYGTELILDVFALVIDLKFTTGELQMPSTSLTSVARGYGAEFLDVPASVFDLKFTTGELEMPPTSRTSVAQGYGTEFLAVPAFVFDLKFITGEMEMPLLGSANIMGMSAKHWWVMFPVTVDSADFVIAPVCGTEFFLDVSVCVMVLKFTMSELKMAPRSSWMSLPFVAMVVIWASLPLGAIDLIDFFVAQGYGVEFIWVVFAFVSDLRFITGELKMLATSLTFVAQGYGAELWDVLAFVFDLKFITGELRMAPAGMCIALAGC
eukprot:3756242-Amphidinium_carterae.1